MENLKIKVKSLISVTAWVVALGMFIAVHDRLCHSAQLPAWNLRSEGGQKEQECILDPSHYPCDGCCDTADVRTGFVCIDVAFGTEEYRVFAFGTK